MRSLLPLVVILLIFGLLIMGPMRRQKRLAAQAQSMRSALGPGDEIMTTSGLYGTITQLADDTVTMEIAPGVPVKVAKAAIGQRVDPTSTEYAGGSAGSVDDAADHAGDRDSRADVRSDDDENDRNHDATAYPDVRPDAGPDAQSR